MTTPQAAPTFTPHVATSITNDALASQRKYNHNLLVVILL
jgi:hypothetical protein